VNVAGSFALKVKLALVDAVYGLGAVAMNASGPPLSPGGGGLTPLGGVVSTVHVRVAAAPTFPAASVARTEKVYVPEVRFETVYGDWHAA
jgi:hypothetical protein